MQPPSPHAGAQAPPDRGLARLLHGLSWLRGYQRRWLTSDALAGISVAMVMIPSVMAYAGLMGLAPQYGLYAAFVPLLVYPLFGSSRQMIVGPDIAISLLAVSTVGPLAAGDPARATVLSAALAIISGLLLLVGARARIGAVADFFSKPVLVGYMTGAALILMASQLDKVFGVTLKHYDFFPRLAELVARLPQTHLLTFVLGMALLFFVIGLRRLAPRIPPTLVVFGAALCASLLLDLAKKGVKVVGTFPGGLPGFSVPLVNWREVHLLLPGAVGIALLTYTEGILLARAFAAKNNYEVNPNQELAALGMADIFGGLFQGFSVTGSQARTTLNDSTGAKTQVASWFAAAALAIFLLFLTPIMARLPQVALAVILLYAGFGLVEFGVMRRIYRYYPSSGLLCGLTTLSVLAAGVVPGIAIGVAFSLLGLITRISRPADAVLRAVPGEGFHDLGDLLGKQTVPGLIAYRFYAPLLFSNIGHFVARVRQIISASPGPVRWFLLDAQAITDMDVTAAEALHALNGELKAQGISLKIAHANPPLRAILQRIGFTREVEHESFFASVHECVAAFNGISQEPPQNPSSTEANKKES